MTSPGDRARDALIETAERLFAQRGIEAVSLREISAAAGNRNHSAAQYHFGDRVGLVAAVFDHRMRVVNERRHEQLDSLRGDDLASLVEATIGPLVEVVAESDGWYGRFLARARWDAFAQQVLLADVPALSSYRRALEAIAALLDLPAPVRVDRLEQMATLFIGTIGGWESRRGDGVPVPSPQSLTEDLVATCCAVLTARVPVTHIDRSIR